MQTDGGGDVKQMITTHSASGRKTLAKKMPGRMPSAVPEEYCPLGPSVGMGSTLWGWAGVGREGGEGGGAESLFIN